MPQANKTVKSLTRNVGARRAFAVVVFVLVAIWALQNFVGEQTWLTSLLLYVPQAIFALPLLVFAIVALRRRDWILVAGVLIALPIFCICFLGFRWNRQHLLPTRIRVVSYNIEQLQNGAASLRFAAQQSPDIL